MLTTYRGLFGIVLLLPILLVACSSSETASHWSGTSVGNPDLFADSAFGLVVDNDGSRVHLQLTSKDTFAQRKSLLFGLSVRLEAGGTPITVDFPRGAITTRGLPAMREMATAQAGGGEMSELGRMLAANTSMLDTITLARGTVTETSTVATAASRHGVRARIAEATGSVLVYDLEIPLSTKADGYGLVAAPGEAFKLSVTTGEPPLPAMKGTGGGPGGRGGAQGKAGSGPMRQRVTFETTVRLAKQ